MLGETNLLTVNLSKPFFILPLFFALAWNMIMSLTKIVMEFNLNNYKNGRHEN